MENKTHFASLVLHSQERIASPANSTREGGATAIRKDAGGGKTVSGSTDACTALPRPASRGLMISEGKLPRSGIFIFSFNHLISLACRSQCMMPHAILAGPSGQMCVLQVEMKQPSLAGHEEEEHSKTALPGPRYGTWVKPLPQHQHPLLGTSSILSCSVSYPAPC